MVLIKLVGNIFTIHKKSVKATKVFSHTVLSFALLLATVHSNYVHSAV